jgi:hypothetical protein
LLVSYVQAIDLAERAARELRRTPVLDGKVNPWIIVQEKAVRTIVALSMRRRLSPQARPVSYYERMTTPGAGALTKGRGC